MFIQLLLVCLGSLFVGIVTFLYFQKREKKRLKKLLENYNESEDKSKLAEEGRSSIRDRYANSEEPELRSTETELSNAGLVEPPREQLLPTTEAISNGKTGDSNGKTRGTSSNFFARLRRKK